MAVRITHIDRGEALRCLGYRGGTIPPETEARIARCEETLKRRVFPRCVWKRFDLLPDGTLKGTAFTFRGQDIRDTLNGCGAAVLMAATLGGEIEAMIRKAQVTDMAEAMIIDACASAAIEGVCDGLCDEIAGQASPLYLTDRFSPGYGDFPLSQQAEIFRLLDISRRIGVSLTESGLMVPQKTVTAVLGLSPVPVRKRPKGCAACPLSETCAYRKDGIPCGKE